MQTGISINGTAAAPSAETVKEIATSLVALIQAGFEAHLDQANMGRLIDAFTSAAEPRPGLDRTTISGCSVQGDRQFIEVEPEEVDGEDDE